MGKKSVYLETSFISYLTSRPSRDVVIAGHQAVTQEWWDNYREDYDLYVSDVVLEEAEEGDQDAARRRLVIAEQLAILDTTDAVAEFAEYLLKRAILPEKAAQDAVHVAIAAVHGMHYLLTWNCKHIANVNKRHRIEQLCLEHGYEPPWISTAEELMGEN